MRRYQDLAFRVACLITGDRDEAQDAVQTAFIKALQALGSFRDDAPFRPWLLRIVANEAKNRVRSNARRASGPLDERIVSLAPSPEELAERSEQQRELLAAIRQLSEQDQQIIAYRYFLDLSETEMADLLDCPRGTVKSRLSRATGRLREELSLRVWRGRQCLAGHSTSPTTISTRSLRRSARGSNGRPLPIWQLMSSPP